MAKKTLILNTTIEGCALQWRDPKDRSRDFSNSIEPWIELAKILERGKLNAFFVADHLSLFDVYKVQETIRSQLVLAIRSLVLILQLLSLPWHKLLRAWDSVSPFQP
jgi:alkanesulfonate monooxygenase SsuD/methylene tetrahydromethanopterin reductase-like flavin-dependent oxidoreductase (luciferase family)